MSRKSLVYISLDLQKTSQYRALMSEILDYWLLLHSIPGMGPATFNKLLQKFSNPQKVFEANRRELMSIPGLTRNLIDSILSSPDKVGTYHDAPLHKISLELRRKGFRIITIYDPDYPHRLKKIKNPPPIIYVYGKLNTAKNIAIIGARLASVPGLKKAFNFAYELAAIGFTIISGYAKGIDTYAHLGAMRGGGRTIMVLPTGVLNFKVHKELYRARDELFSRGTILSEFFPDAGWTTSQAILRNRITAGFSDAMLVVEPGTRGGTISTARWAKEQGKPLFIWRGGFETPFHTQRDKEILGMGAIEVEDPEEIVNIIGPK